jgi:hypothetical protein
MSGKKVSELQELISLEDNDLLVVVDDSELDIANKSKNVKVSTIRDEISEEVSSEASLRSQQDVVLQENIDAEQIRAQSAESDLQDNIDQVEIDLLAEQSIREGADNALQQEIDSRVGPFEHRTQFNGIYAYEDNASVYADGVAPVVDPSPFIRDGWYFTNSVAGSKINWYFFDGNPLSATYQGEATLEDFSAYAVLTLDSLASAPIIAIYTLPTGTNDVIPGFAHSRSVYSGYVSGSPEAGKKCLIYVGQDPLVHPELPRFQMAVSVASSAGDLDPSEVVLTASFGSNSAAATGSVQFLAESLGVNSPSVKQDMELRLRTVGLDVNSKISESVLPSYLSQSSLSNKANTNLSNLVTTSIPSGVDIISNSGSGVQFDVKTATSSSGNTGIVAVGSGNTTAGGSGYVEIISGTGTSTSGAVYVETSRASTGVSGSNILVTGAIANDGYLINNGSNGSSTGSVSIQSGLINSTFSYPVGSTVRSGNINVNTGNSNSRAGSGFFIAGSGIVQSSTGVSGQVEVRSGSATASGGSSGNTFVLSGSVTTGAGTSGVIEVRSGATIDGNTGAASISSGSPTGTGSSGFAQVKSGNTVNGSTGNVTIYSGASTGTGNTGVAQVFSGTSTSGSTGNVTIASGDSSSAGATGNVTLQTGSTSGARGEVVVNSPALNMNSNIITNTAAFYFGDPNVDGTYRIRPSGGSLVTERLELGVWVVKQTIPSIP